MSPPVRALRSGSLANGSLVNLYRRAIGQASGDRNDHAIGWVEAGEYFNLVFDPRSDCHQARMSDVVFRDVDGLQLSSFHDARARDSQNAAPAGVKERSSKQPGAQ